MTNIKEKETWFEGGSDGIFTRIRTFSYYMEEQSLCKSTKYRHMFKLPYHFDIDPEEFNKLDRRDERSHLRLLDLHPFTVNDINVIDWFENLSIKGKVKLEFRIDSSIEHIHKPEAHRGLTAKISDSNITLLFKMSFV